LSAVRASLATRCGFAEIRDLCESDIESIVRYWCESGDDHLDFLGIDRALLGSPDLIRQRFQAAVPSGDPGQANIAFAILLDGAITGYTLLNRYSAENNYSHWHITDPRRRAAGLSTALYPYRIKTYFDAASIARLIHQTRTRNSGVNRMLDRFVPVAQTLFIDRPDGVAQPGEFHLRYVDRAHVPRLFEIAARLTAPPE
jgi:hypothetical protein